MVVHVLTFAGETPRFGYNDLINEAEQLSEKAVAKENTPQEATTLREEPITNDGLIGNESKNDDMGQGVDRLGRSRNRAPRPVAQISTHTLEVVKIWPKKGAAEKILGISNIDRAIKRHRPAGGFYWCDETDLETFQPAEDRRCKNARKSRVGATKEMPKETTEEAPKEVTKAATTSVEQDAEPVSQPTTKSDLSDFQDADLALELQRRGWRGDICLTTKPIMTVTLHL